MPRPSSSGSTGGAADPRHLPLSSAFHFAVTLNTMQVGHKEAAFQEASGLAADMETETLMEGGRNDFVHFLPKPVKHPRLVLKRGLAPLTSLWVRWCKSTLEGGLARRLTPADLRVALLSADGTLMRQWLLTRAYPVKWDVEAFNSQRNEMAIERIELVYARSERSI